MLQHSQGPASVPAIEHDEYFAHLYDVVISHVEELVAVLLDNGYLL
jgi:hypothetical protein